jgi:methylated-DNA-[protein]-cysteine S-methyltransferase
MSELGFTLFDTAIGRCGLVWTAQGIAGVRFPERDDAAMRNRLLRRFPAARESMPPAAVQSAIAAIAALLAGKRCDLRDVPLDLQSASDFNRRVYDVARNIRAGTTLTYGEVAAQLGDRALAREVAQALSENPCPIIVPCHRVMAAGGKTGGFSAPGGVRTKLRLLSIEGAAPDAGDGPMLFDHLPLAARRPRRRA